MASETIRIAIKRCADCGEMERVVTQRAGGGRNVIVLCGCGAQRIVRVGPGERYALVMRALPRKAAGGA